jgi:tetratricopeptide (TPR) repeat protein
MAYPGDANLDPAVQQRILTAFKEAVRLYRDGHGEEARTILRSITDVDPRFTPAQRLEQAIAAGAPVDLGQLIGEVTAQGGVDAAGTMAKANQAFAGRDFQGALTLAQSVLRDMPGHAQARQLAFEAQNRLRAAGEIQTHLGRVRQALDAGLAEDARGFLQVAKTLDPGHPDLALLEQRLQLAAKPPKAEAEPEFEFEVFDQPADLPPAPPPAEPAQPFAVPAAPPRPAPSRPAAPAPQPAPAKPVPPVAASAPLAAPPPPGPPPPSPAPPAAAAFSFDEPAADGRFEFHAGPADAFSAGVAPPAPAESAAARVQTLLEQGQREFDRGDFQAAVDTWSRIYLVDVSNAEADRRIDQARRRREEVERLAEQNFYEAHEAFEQKRFDDARLLCQQVLKLVPQHLEAHDLLQRLETPAAPPPPPPPPAPSLAHEEDLFRDEFVPATISSSGSVPAVRGPEAPTQERVPGERRAPGAVPAVAKRLAALPLMWIGVAVAVLAIAGGAAFVLRGKVFSGPGAAVTEALAESEQLANQGRLQAAIEVLQSLQGQVEGEQANRVNQRILEYQRKLKAKTAPAPATDSKAVKDALAAGLRVKAMGLIRAGLAKVPGDPELARLESELTAYAPGLSPLADAVANKNWDSIRSLADQVLKSHPDDAEVLRLWSAATFNLAVIELRKYKVADGHELLVELSKRATDPDVERLRELAKSYLSRPVDPRYQIFVSNVELRQAE